MSGETTFWETVDALRESHRRYAREAYGFVVDALVETARSLPAVRREDPERRHLSGRELLAAVVSIARRDYGPMAAVVFREWGVRSSEDVGEIVFELVRAGHLSARREDSIDDFRGGPDLAAELARDVELGPPRAGHAGDRPAPAA